MRRTYKNRSSVLFLLSPDFNRAQAYVERHIPWVRTMSFGKRVIAAEVTRKPVVRQSPVVAHLPAIALVAAALFLCAWIFWPRPFPADGTIFAQCDYAVRKTGFTQYSTFCRVDTTARQTVAGYHLWEQYGAKVPDFPYLADEESRCLNALGYLTIFFIENAGVKFADVDDCKNPDKQDNIVRQYLEWKVRK